MALVQSFSATQTAVDANHDITLSGVTAGNLLVLVDAAVDGSLTVSTPPAGWTFRQGFSGGVHSGAIYTKTASGSEGATQVVWSANTAGTMWCGEWNDTLAGGFDVSAENEANLASVVTSQSTGTAAATGAGLSIGIIVSDALSTIDGTPVWSNSYAQQALVISANSARPGIGVATLSHGASGNQTTTYSCTDTGDEMYGAILCFLTAAGGGPAPAPRTRTLMGVGV